MSKPTKTTRMITWPDGRKVELHRRGGSWHWTTLQGHGATSSHLDSALLSIKEEGGEIEIVPNRYYTEQTKAYQAKQARSGARLVSDLLTSLMRR